MECTHKFFIITISSVMLMAIWAINASAGIDVKPAQGSSASAATGKVKNSCRRILIARVNTTVKYQPNGRFKGCWIVSLPLQPGIAGDWKARGWDQRIFEGTAIIETMQKPFGLTIGFAEAPVGSGEIGKHVAFAVCDNISTPQTINFSSGTVIDKHGKGKSEHTDFRHLRSFFFIIWQPNHSWRGPEQFAMSPDYYPIKLQIAVYLVTNKP